MGDFFFDPGEGRRYREEHREANKALWNEFTEIHLRSEFYDLEGFRAGRLSLDPVEVDELGDVTGKKLLHLQCHFGMDTISWARLGAEVTGVDFSERGIETARSLSDGLGISAQFVCANVYDLPQVLQGEYDFVYTGGGVLTWLPDLKRWGKIIAHFLKPGGVFYLREFHPFAWVFDDTANLTELKIAYPYFHSDEPLVLKVEGSYADREAQVTQEVTFEWGHTMGDIINALIGAGLRIEFLHEFPFCGYAMFPSLMARGSDGMYRLRDQDGYIPLMFSIRAVKA